MPENSSGTETGIDSLMIAFTQDELKTNIIRFTDENSNQEDIREYFGIKGGTGDKLLAIRKTFLKDFIENGTKYIQKSLYRSFDIRFVYYKKDYLKTNSYRVMRHLGKDDNLALIAFRQQSQDGFNHIFVTEIVGDKNAVSLRTREINYYFPLYTFNDDNSIDLHLREKQSNLSDEFLSAITNKLGYTPTPEAIFYYIYAIFHSPTYRTRYAEFLKIDFPRVPLTSDDQLFRKLGEYGEELVALHLMKSPKLDQPLTQIIDKGGEFVVDVGHPNIAMAKLSSIKKATDLQEYQKAFGNFMSAAIKFVTNGSKTAKVVNSAPKTSTTIKKSSSRSLKLCRL